MTQKCGYLPKYISLILIVALLCGMLPQTVFRASAEGTEHVHSYASGACTGCGIKDYRDVTYVAFGDSITYGVDGNYRDGPGRIMSNPYPKLVGQLLNFGTVSNQGVSGGTLCADSGRTNMTERILNFNGEADVISVMLGVNDYYVKCPMGDPDSTDNKTIYGSLNLICQHLTENYPDAFLFFMTPFQLRGGENDRGAGYNLAAVAEVVKTVAAKYDIPVLDMYTYGKFEEEFNDTSLAYQDGIHPSQQHHIKYTAPMIAEFIAENYEGLKEESGQPETEGKIIYAQQTLTKGYCTVNGSVAVSSVHSYFTMDAAGIETITITPPDAPAWNPLNIYYIVIVEEDGTVSCYGKLNKQEPTVIELGGKVKGTVYFNAFYDDTPQYVYVKEAIVTAHEHTYETAVTEPTCTEQGYTTYTCSSCGDSYVDSYEVAAGHSYDNGFCSVCNSAEGNLWNGRSAVFVGDSITAGTGTDKIYYQFLTENLGFGSVTAMGVPGSCISVASDYGQSNQPLNDRYQNIPSADLILIFMGTNDYGHETPLGSPEDAQDGTFYGALNTIIPALVAKHTSSKIVFVTPLHRYGFGTSGILGTQFTYDSIPNGVGATLGDYVDAMKTVCASNDVSVIDLYTECTLDPSDAAVRAEYLPDGLHPNAAGHEVIAGIMESHIRSYKPVEQEPVELTEMIYGNKFAAGNNQTCRSSSRVNYYLKAGTVITLKDPDTFQWACTKTSDETSSSNLGYFPDGGWSDKETAVVEADGWVGFVFKYRDETQVFELTKPLSDYITIEEPHTHTYENGICTGCGSTTSPYLQQLPEDITGCSNLYSILTPTKGYYTATKYDTSNGAVLSVVIPVEPGDRVAASSFGSVTENMGSVNGIRVTYLLDGTIVESLSASSVYTTYTQEGYLTVPKGVNMVSVPWWAPSDSNWLTLGQISKNFAAHSPKAVPAQAPTCTENGYTAGEICEFCDASLGSREEIPATGHDYNGNTCNICGAVNLSAILNGKYVSVLGDSISTFNGYSNDATVNSTIGGNGPRYDVGTADTKPGSYCLLESVDDTWWMHFANRSGMKLLVNNSWAGSQVFGGQTSDGRQIPPAYLERCINLHDNTIANNPGNAPINPDVIFVYLGINDYNFNRSNVGDGTVDYALLVNSDGTYVTPSTFGEAYGILLHKMKQAYPDAQIFAMTLLPENLYSVDKAAWEQHNAYIRAAAEYYDIPVVDLAEKCAITWDNYSGYMMDKIHPTTAGMQLISDCIEAELVAYYTANPPHAHAYTTTVTAPTCTEQGYTTYTCACGDSYVDNYVDALEEHRYNAGVCIWCERRKLGGDWLIPEFAEGDYTMVVLPDTQNLITYWPEIYYGQMQWIADHQESLNIQAVMHMGDMVNNNNDTEWTICEAGTDILENAGIPWMPMRGNHDDSTWFNKYYDYATYGTDQSWFGGSYHEDKLDHAYWFVTVGDREYLILSLGWAPSWDVLAWAQGIVEANPDKNVIVNCHAYMNKDGTFLSAGDSHCVSSYYPGYPNGDDVWAALKDYENVVLAMGGHIHSPDVITYVDKNGEGQDVTSLLFDRQDDDTSNRYAMVGLLTFHADSDVVDVNWVSTRYDALYQPENQFAVTVPHVGDDMDTVGVDITDRFAQWTTGGPVLYADGFGYGEPGYTSGGNPNLKHSDYIPVEEFDMLRLTICGRTSYSATGGFAFYTEEDPSGFINYGKMARTGSGAFAEGVVIRNIAVPENAKYIRVSYWSDASSYTSVSFSCVGYKQVAHCDHVYDEVVTAPTCAEDGYTTHICTLCGHSFRDSETAALGHDFKEVVTAPTCTEAGFTTNICNRCGHTEPATQVTDITDLFVWEDQKMIIAITGEKEAFPVWMACDYVDISDYDFLEIKTANTATATSTTGLAFYDANKNYISGVIHTDKSGVYGVLIHNLEIPENAVYVRSTWYSKNHQAYIDAFGEFYCKGVVVKREEPLGHDYASVVTAPTCTEQGYTTHACHCGDSYVDTYVDATGHSYENGLCIHCGAHLPGDINGDGEVNNKDATRLFQYMTGWRVEVVEAALDVNGDGRVNNKDATRLFQYLSGWSVEIH